MTKIKKEIYTKRKHKKRQDSFWYVGDGDIAKFTKGDREVIVSVCGEIRAYFPDEEVLRKNEEAAYIATIRNYFDKDLEKLDFSNTNWFAFRYKNGYITDYNDIFGDVASNYDEALKEAKDCLDNDEFWSQFPTSVDNGDFEVWEDLLSKLAWKFKPTESGDMFIDAEKVYSELKELFDLKYK